MDCKYITENENLKIKQKKAAKMISELKHEKEDYRRRVVGMENLCEAYNIEDYIAARIVVRELKLENKDLKAQLKHVEASWGYHYAKTSKELINKQRELISNLLIKLTELKEGLNHG